MGLVEESLGINDLRKTLTGDLSSSEKGYPGILPQDLECIISVHDQAALTTLLEVIYSDKASKNAKKHACAKLVKIIDQELEQEDLGPLQVLLYESSEKVKDLYEGYYNLENSKVMTILDFMKLILDKPIQPKVKLGRAVLLTQLLSFSNDCDYLQKQLSIWNSIWNAYKKD